MTGVLAGNVEHDPYKVCPVFQMAWHEIIFTPVVIFVVVVVAAAATAAAVVVVGKKVKVLIFDVHNPFSRN